MRKSFSSHSQLCHVWAQQTQEEGSTKNLYFKNYTDIYSYGGHYLAAKIHTVNGNRVALINSYTYSSSTGRHLNHIRRSVHGHIPYFYGPVPETLDHEENIAYYDNLVVNESERILTLVKVEHERYIEYHLERLAEVLEEANDFFKLIDHKPIVIPQEMRDLLKEQLTYRYERYKKLNTPEEREKREAAKNKREALKTERELAQLENDVNNWRNVMSNNRSFSSKLKFDILRVRETNEGFLVETSGGANVPLSHALRLLVMIESGRVREGERIGHFTYERWIDIDGDKLIKIGCHKIRLSEAQSVLSPYRNSEIKLVSND